MWYASPVMLRVPQHHPGRKHRGRGCCAISEHPTPPLFALSSFFRTLSPTIPVHTQKQGGTPLHWHDQSFHFGNALASTDLHFPFFLCALRVLCGKTSCEGHLRNSPGWGQRALSPPHHGQLLPYESYPLRYLPLHYVSMSARRHFRLPVTSHKSRGQRLEL